MSTLTESVPWPQATGSSSESRTPMLSSPPRASMVSRPPPRAEIESAAFVPVIVPTPSPAWKLAPTTASGVDLERVGARSGAGVLDLAAADGLDGRVRFLDGDPARVALEGPYELVLLLDPLGDMPRPEETLAAARSALRDHGHPLVRADRQSPLYPLSGRWLSGAVS